MKRQWENEELVEHWTLDVEERALLDNKTGATRLGFAVLLKFFRREGRFPQHKNEVPGIVITFLATQVGVDATAYMQYAWQGRTIEYHRAQIRDALGFRESSVADGEQMQQWLITEVLPQEHQDERLREQAYAWFRRMHLEAPTPDRLTRLIRSAAHTFEHQFYEATLTRLPEASQAALEALLLTEIAPPELRDADGEKEDSVGRQEGQPSNMLQERKAQIDITLHQLRMDPGRVGLATMLEEMAKLRRIRELALPDDLFPGIARKVLAVYRNRASIEEPSRLRFKRVGNKEGILYRVAEAAVGRPDEPVREVIFPVASEKLLQEVIKEYKAKSPAFRKQVHLIMRASYSHHYRRMVPELLEILDFHSNNELYRPVIRALQLVKDYVHSPRQYYPDHESIPIKEVVAPKWREFVVEQEDDGTSRVNRLNYEVCTLQALREKVRVREIWIEGANRYRDYVEYVMLTFPQFEAPVYHEYDHPWKDRAHSCVLLPVS